MLQKAKCWSKDVEKSNFQTAGHNETRELGFHPEVSDFELFRLLLRTQPGLESAQENSAVFFRLPVVFQPGVEDN